MHGDNGFLWRGALSDEVENKCGKMLLDAYNCSNKFDFDEGKESDDFWSLLGGKAAYENIRDQMQGNSDFEPTLYHISNS